MPDGMKVGSAYIELSLDQSKLNRGLAAVEAEMKDLQRDLQAGVIGVDVFERRLEELAQEATILRGALDDVGNAANRQAAAMASASVQTHAVSTGMASVGATASGRGAMGIMQFAYAIDDAQYGMRGLGNNLIQMATYLPGPWAGGIAVATAAATVLYNQWDNLTQLLGLETTLDEVGRMAQLEKQTKKTADEQREYNRLKQQQTEIERLSQMQTRESQDTRAAVEDVFRESAKGGVSGFDLTVKGLVEQRKQAGTFARMGPDDREELAKLDAQIANFKRTNPLQRPKVFEDKRQAILDRIEKEGIHRAEKDVSAAGGGGNALEALINQVERTPGAFPPGLAEQLRAATPKGRAEEHAIDVQAEEAGAEATASGKGASKNLRDRRRAANREADALNRQGIANQKASDDEAERQKDKARTDAERARERQVRTRVTQFSGVFTSPLVTAMERHQRRGVAPEQSDADLARQVEMRLRNVAPDLRADVARGIIEKARMKQEARQAERELRGIPPVPEQPPRGRRPPAGERGRPGSGDEARAPDEPMGRRFIQPPRSPIPPAGDRQAMQAKESSSADLSALSGTMRDLSAKVAALARPMEGINQMMRIGGMVDHAWDNMPRL